MTQSKFDSCLKGLDRFVRQRMKDWNVPGVAVGIVKGNRIIFMKGYGFRDVNRQLPVAKDTLFAIASCTKAFTATAIGILVDEGKLEWDRPIRRYIPWFKMYDPVATERMTIRDVLTHKSGIARYILMEKNAAVSRKELVRRLRYLPPSPVADFRTKRQYTTLMYAVAGLLIEYITGKTWEQFVKDRIFKPLGMISSRYLIDDIPIEQMAVGYKITGRKLTPALKIFEQKVDFATALGSACGPGNAIVSNIEDMCRWTTFQINQGKVGRHQVISEKSLKEIHTPQTVCPEWDSKCKLLLDTSVCLGWHVRGYRGYRLVLHGGGSILGFNIQVMFLPNERLGAVVLTNVSGSPLDYVIHFNIFERLLGLKQFPWNTRAKRFAKIQEIGAKKKKKIGKPKGRKHPSLPLKKYTGTYRHPGYGSWSVSAERKKLVFRFDTFTLRFKHSHDDVFQMTKSGSDVYFPNLKATFNISKTGKIRSVSMSVIFLHPEVNLVFKKIKSKKE